MPPVPGGSRQVVRWVCTAAAVRPRRCCASSCRSTWRPSSPSARRARARAFPGAWNGGFRMERSGMRWILSGARAMLDMRCIYLSGLWEELTRFASSANPGASTQDVPPTTRISARHSPRSGRGQRVAPLSIYSFRQYR
jgi:hypothetical protein